jgi:hypothetical protein
VPNVAFISSDYGPQSPPEPNGCTWYRCILPSRELQKHGWDTGVGMPGASEKLGLGIAYEDGMLAGWDINIFKLLMHQQVLEFMGVMQRNGQTVGVDVDDFFQGLHKDNVAAALTDPLVNNEVNRVWLEQIIRAADFVTVSTAFLADWYSSRVRDVRLVRNGVDFDRWPQRDVSGDPVVGWIGGTLWRSGDIESLSEWLPEFVEDHGVTVHHGGHLEGKGPSFADRAGLKVVRTTGMLPVSDYPDLFGYLNIGLVPLVPVPFNEAKSNIKGLEYAASGIPFVAYPSHEYRLLAESGVGRLAETPDEWRDHVTELLDESVRVEEGARIREIVGREWSMEVRGKSWDIALRG